MNWLLGVIASISFSWNILWLVIAYLRTLLENPGTIPDDLEWDLLSETESDIECPHFDKKEHPNQKEIDERILLKQKNNLKNKL